MTDAEKIYYQTNSERKRNGAGDRNKKRQGGHSVHFPSDYLTRKEKERMNGECVTYTMDKPMGWGEYQVLPDDIKRAYLLALAEKYEATPAMLAMMFGKSRKVCGFEQRRLKIGQTPSRGRVPKPIMDKREAFLKTEEPAEQEPPKQDPPKQEPIEKTDEISKIVEMLASLRGTGAKITIEITL